MMTFDIGSEFDVMYSLVREMGFSGADCDTLIGYILHSINEVLKGCISNG